MELRPVRVHRNTDGPLVMSRIVQGCKNFPKIYEPPPDLRRPNNDLMQVPYCGQGAVLQIGRSLVRSQLVSLEFFIDIKSFRSHYDPGVNSASNRNEYQEHFLGVKEAGA